MRAVAVLHELVWSLAVVALGIAGLVLGVTRDERGLVIIGAVLLFFGTVSVLLNVRPSRSRTDDDYGPP